MGIRCCSCLGTKMANPTAVAARKNDENISHETKKQSVSELPPVIPPSSNRRLIPLRNTKTLPLELPTTVSDSLAVEIKLKHIRKLRDHMYPATNCFVSIRDLPPSDGRSSARENPNTLGTPSPAKSTLSNSAIRKRTFQLPEEVPTPGQGSQNELFWSDRLIKCKPQGRRISKNQPDLESQSKLPATLSPDIVLDDCSGVNRSKIREKQHLNCRKPVSSGSLRKLSRMSSSSNTGQLSNSKKIFRRTRSKQEFRLNLQSSSEVNQEIMTNSFEPAFPGMDNSKIYEKKPNSTLKVSRFGGKDSEMT